MATLAAARDSLRGVRRVDDDGVLGLVIDDEIGVVVGTTNPCSPALVSVKSQ